MNLNFLDLIAPIVDRFNKEAEKLAEYIKGYISCRDITIAFGKGAYGVIERITLAPKFSALASVEICIRMDNTADFVHLKNCTEVVHSKKSVDLWNPAEFQEEMKKIDTYLKSEQIN